MVNLFMNVTYYTYQIEMLPYADGNVWNQKKGA